MTLEEMQDAIAAKSKPARVTVAAMYGGAMPSYEVLARRESALSRTRPLMDTAAPRKTVSDARAAAIVAHVRSNPGATVNGVADALGVGPDSARVGMVLLEKQGRLARGEKCKTGAPWTATP